MRPDNPALRQAQGPEDLTTPFDKLRDRKLLTPPFDKLRDRRT